MSPFDQSRYQVRCEWGLEGLRRLAPADVVVVVDVLRFSSSVTEAVADGPVALDENAHAVSRNGAAVAEEAGRGGALVLLGCLRNASAVAEAVVAEQHRRGRRTSIAVICAGERVPGADDAPVRFAVEDLLGAGAVIDALGIRGIDHTAPEAAAAGEAFRGLRGAVRHLLSASGSGQELLERGAAEEVRRAAEIDGSPTVPVLRDGAFCALSSRCRPGRGLSEG